MVFDKILNNGRGTISVVTDVAIQITVSAVWIN